jgi:hypothetical protein
VPRGELAAFSFRCGAIRCGANGLSLCFTSAGLSQTYGLARRNERGRARADVGRADNCDNLRRDVHRGAMSGERDEKIQDRCENRVQSCCP